MNKNNGCTWTAWGDVVCQQPQQERTQTQKREHFGQGSTTCSGDQDCDARSRCDNLNVDASFWKCAPCADIGCQIGKSCGCAPGDPTCSQSSGGSSDCAQGLSCQNSVCTAGSVITHLNNSDFRVMPADTDTVSKSYEVLRQSHLTLDASSDGNVPDCVTQGTCEQGQPCDMDSLTAQCSSGLFCDAGMCKMSYGTL